MNKEEIIKLLKNTTIEEEIGFLSRTYEELKQKEDLFCNTLCIHCDEGCGKCCEQFVPDISSLEADYLAFGLIADGLDEEVLKKLESYDSNFGYCPLYNFIDNHHCTVYQYRPLICRLFAASASKDKAGKPAYRDCKYKEHKVILSEEALELNKDILVFMQDYGLSIDEFDEEQGRTTLIKDALIKAIYKVRYMIELCEESKNTKNN